MVLIFKLKKVFCVNIVCYIGIYFVEMDLGFGIKGLMLIVVVLVYIILRVNVSSIEFVVLVYINLRFNLEVLNGLC